MATTLGAQASQAPLPTGESKRALGYGTQGQRPMPAADNWLYLNMEGDIANLYFRKPYRFFLMARAWMICQSGGGWYATVPSLKLVPPDINSVQWCVGYTASESNGHADPWKQITMEGRYYCEANTDYYIQLVSFGGGSGGGTYYCGASAHIGLVAHSVGEGVY